MSRTWIIAIREFRRTVLTKAFLIGAVVVPVAFVGISIAAAAFLKPTIEPMVGELAIQGANEHFITALHVALAEDDDGDETTTPRPPDGADTTERIDAALADAQSKPQQERPSTDQVNIVDVGPQDDLSIRDGIRNGIYFAAIIVHPSSNDGGHKTLELIVPPTAPNSHVQLLERSSRTAAVDARLLIQGYAPASLRQLFARPRLKTTRLDRAGGEHTEAEWTRWVVPVIMMGLIWMTVMTGGNYLLTSTIEEKSSKVIEVLLSACSPRELISGKILGFGMVTVLMLSMYALVAAAILSLLAAADVIRLDTLIISALCLVMAYLMIASMMAGVGAAVSDLTEAQSLLGPVTIVIMAPLLLIPVVTEDPEGIVAIVTTFIPPLTPFILVLRVAASADPLPWFEVLAALIIGFAAAFAMTWAAGRIFRVGVLMQGKPPSLRELLRWVRYR
jgi:ABC-2 type transport system permease protein